MKFEVGDKVQIRNDLQCNKHYGTNDVCVCMLDYLGKEGTVTYVTDCGEYFIDIDDEMWSWTSEMFISDREVRGYEI